MKEDKILHIIHKYLRMKRLLRILPYSSRTAQAISPYIYFSPEHYSKIIKSQDPYLIGVFVHELEHINQQTNIGQFKWFAKYFISKRFRYQQELEAIYSQLQYYEQNKVEYDLQKIAKSLSSSLYLYMISYNEAHAELNKMSSQIKGAQNMQKSR